MLDVAVWWQIARAASLAAALGCASLALGTLARASDRMLACAGGAVMVGAAEEEVRSKCGEPTSRQKSTSRGSGSSSRSRGGGGSSKRGGARANRGSGETWVYDLGPGRLVRYLSFQGGRLERVDVGGYGH
jgi:hypothetical protein